ncbi:MAG TPA: hypothetical protein VFC31_15890 [Candidatus Limnocylindria bacterium]|nr:hypothetical protein [Candidatus Limnocylindria bacterium]
MILRRILATTASSVFVVGALASCGGGTGETATSATLAPSVAATSAAAATSQKATFLILQGDTVRSPEGLTDEEKAYLSCVQQSRFPQGSRIVWRFRVLDPLTNKPLDDKAMASFDLILPDGSKTPFKYGGHGGTKENPAEYFWTAGFSIPKDYPTGLFSYQVKAVSTAGATGTFEQMKVPAAQLTIVPLGKR